MKFFSYRFTSIFLFFSRAIGAAERKFSNNFSTIESSGVPICFKDQGEGPPVFFIHGYTSNALDWNIAINLLKDRFRLITIDCRGHGASGKPEDLTFYGRKMVADILEVLQKLEIEKVCLVGYSMGAEIALRFTVEHPEVVTGLVVGGSGWSGKRKQSFILKLEIH